MRVSRRTRLVCCLLATGVGGWLLPAAAQAAPTNNTPPSISGTAQVGKTLTLAQGTWTDAAGAAITVTDVWEDCVGGACTAITGATGSSYTLASTDVGATIEVVETATTTTDGSASVTSAATGAVLPAAPTIGTPGPTISGTPDVGQTLTASTGTWNNTPTSYTYQWESCSGATCSAVGSNSSTYTVSTADVGHTIEVEVTASNAGGSSTPATSAATAAVTALAPVISVAPTITGTAQQGQTLTAGTGTWTNTPVSYAYQWESCTVATPSTCTAITGATAATYVIAATDVGKTIEVEVTATNTGGTSTPAASLATATVVPPVPTETSAPSISGVYQEGSVLTELHGGWTNTPTSYSYEWLRCDSAGANCVAITGATAQTYAPVAADVGATLVVLETATNAGGNSAPAESALTPVITTPAQVVPVPVSSSPPTVSGSLEQGQTLVESHGTWSGNPGSFSYQWERCNAAGCTAISGANSQTYTLTAADVGQTIAVVESASNAGGAGAAVGSARSAMVTATSLVTLLVSTSAPVTNQTVTLAATVTSSSGNADPAGSLTFENAASPISGCANQNFTSSAQSVTIICQASFNAGSARLTATYHPGGGSLVGGSTSAAQPIVVGKGSTSVSLAVTKQIALHKPATYVATVVPPAGNSGPTEPTGSVEFFDHGLPIKGCHSRALNQLAAKCTIAYKAPGNHRITARYGGDANFAGSASPVRVVRAGKSASGPVVLGFVSSTVRWTFYYTRNYTQLLFLQVFGVSNASTMKLTCNGKGCPFVKLRAAAADSASCPSKAGSVCSTGSSINLLPAFRKRHLAAGSQITLSITRPNWIGKYYSFTIRGGQPPMINLSCLAVGGTRPGVGC